MEEDSLGREEVSRSSGGASLLPLPADRRRNRGLLKLSLESYPLQEAGLSNSCTIRSVAVVNEEDDDLLMIFVGTDSGQLLLFTRACPEGSSSARRLQSSGSVSPSSSQWPVSGSPSSLQTVANASPSSPFLSPARRLSSRLSHAVSVPPQLPYFQIPRSGSSECMQNVVPLSSRCSSSGELLPSHVQSPLFSQADRFGILNSALTRGEPSVDAGSPFVHDVPAHLMLLSTSQSPPCDIVRDQLPLAPIQNNAAFHSSVSHPPEIASDSFSGSSPTSLLSSDSEPEPDFEGRSLSVVSGHSPLSRFDPLVLSAGVSQAKPTLMFRVGRVLGRTHIKSLCPLPNVQLIAALLDEEIVILNLHTLGSVKWLPVTKGATAIARAFGWMENMQNLMGISVKSAGLTWRRGGNMHDFSKRSAGQGHLGRLFGAGRVLKKYRNSGSLTVDTTDNKESLHVDGGLSDKFGGTSSFGMKLGNNADKSGSPEVTKESFVQPSGRTIPLKGVERFAVAVPKKLILYEVHLGEKSRGDHLGIKNSAATIEDEFLDDHVLKVTEIDGADGIVTMAWLGNVIIAGNYQGYMLFSVFGGQASLLFSLPQEHLSPPFLKPFPTELEVLLAIDNLGIVVNTVGQPTSGSLHFKAIPDAVGQSSPYVVTIEKGMLELYHRKTGARMQSIALTDTGGGPFLMADDFNGNYVVATSEFKIYCFERVPLDEQLLELLRQNQFNEAVEVAKECLLEVGKDHAKERLALVHAQAGFLLFFDLHFKDAVDHFLQSDVMLPSEIFPFFPHWTKRWCTLIQKNRYYGLHPPPQDLQTVIENKLQNIQKGLILRSVSDMNVRGDESYLSPVSAQSRAAALEKYQMQAFEQVIRYLKEARSKPLAPLMREGVDTLLMKLYIEVAATEEMEQLAASDNYCLLEELDNLLQISGQLRTLAFLYENKGMQSHALQVWRTLAQGSSTLAAVETMTDMESVKNNLESSIKTSSSQYAAAQEASRLLEASSDSSLVLQHLEWIMCVSQDLALNILCSLKRSNLLPPDIVLASLHPNESYVQQQYLQWLVHKQMIDDARYHTLYAISLAKSAMESISASGVQTESNDAPAGTSNIGKKKVERQKELCNGCIADCITEKGDLREGYEGYKEGDVATELKCSSSQNVRNTLQEFLEMSNKYDAEAVLTLVRNSELWNEQAILYRKLGDEVSFFRILVLELGDTEGAEQYCAHVGRSDAYMRLLALYLNPGSGIEPMYGAAASLLEFHETSLDPFQVLEALPPEMPLHLAFQTISQMLRTRVHQRHEGQIVRNLSRAENFEARVARLEERSRHICITDRSTCGSCFARLGMKLFALYPNDSVVCYKCFRHSGEHIDPATGRNFQNDPMFRLSHWLRHNAT